MNPTQLFDPASHAYTYVLFDETSREALIIDPVNEQIERDIDTLQRLNLKLNWAVETHAHADRASSAAELAKRTGARLAAPAGCELAAAAMVLKDGDTLTFGREQLRVLHTPGHTAQAVCYYWVRAPHEATEVPTDTANLPLGHEMRPDLREDERHVFTGDTLLIGGCGRTDLPSGSAGQLYDSITQVLFELPGDTIVWPGSDDNEHTQSTIALEKSTNPRLLNRSREAFVQQMDEMNSATPQRADEAPVAPAEGYAGNIAPQTAWQWLQAGRAVLVDVRTDAEREWVGFVPGAMAVAWKQWPGMALNADFDSAVRAAADRDQPLMMLCRSGVRSIAAARRATELGLTAYNVVGGFEGDADSQAQRGHVNGWRHAGLPWRQS